MESLAQSAPRRPEGAADTRGGGGPAPQPAPSTGKSEQDGAERKAPREAHSSMELLEMQQGLNADAPLCFSCGTKMRRAGSCYLCEGCGSTSGCS